MHSIIICCVSPIIYSALIHTSSVFIQEVDIYVNDATSGFKMATWLFWSQLSLLSSISTFIELNPYNAQFQFCRKSLSLLTNKFQMMQATVC